MAILTVTYPSGPDFDLEYYLNTHMPLVVKIWGPCGLQSYEIVQFGAGQPQQIQAILKWDSVESINKAPKDELVGDIKNFTTAQPIFVSGESKSHYTL